MSAYPHSDNAHPVTAIRTASGLLVDLADFRVRDVRMADIARSLAHQERYTGHCPLRPTVAQHSLAVEHIALQIMPDECGDPSDLAGREESARTVSRAALMHDAAETYVSDLSAPMKRALRREEGCTHSAFDAVEAAITRAVQRRFGCSAVGWMDVVHEADVLAWQYESAYQNWSPSAALDLPAWLARDLYVARCYPLGANDGGEAAFLRRAAALGMRDA